MGLDRRNPVSHGSVGSLDSAVWFLCKVCREAAAIGRWISKVASLHAWCLMLPGPLSFSFSSSLFSSLHVVWPSHTLVVSERSCMVSGFQESGNGSCCLRTSTVSLCHILLELSQALPRFRGEGMVENQTLSLNVGVAESQCGRARVVGEDTG